MTEELPSGGWFVDSMLLVLLVVGRVDNRFVAQHRKTRQFSPADYDLLCNMIGTNPVFVMPNTLTEVSNLLLQGAGDPHRFLDELARLTGGSHEAIIVSKRAVRNIAFRRLGLADAALLEAVSHRRRLITADLKSIPSRQEEGLSLSDQLHGCPKTTWPSSVGGGPPERGRGMQTEVFKGGETVTVWLRDQSGSNITAR